MNNHITSTFKLYLDNSQIPYEVSRNIVRNEMSNHEIKEPEIVFNNISKKLEIQFTRYFDNQCVKDNNEPLYLLFSVVINYIDWTHITLELINEYWDFLNKESKTVS